jgi:hypothetical protein
MVQLRAEQDIEARRRAMQSLQMLFNLDSGSNLVSLRQLFTSVNPMANGFLARFKIRLPSPIHSLLGLITGGTGVLIWDWLSNKSFSLYSFLYKGD